MFALTQTAFAQRSPFKEPVKTLEVQLPVDQLGEDVFDATPVLPPELRDWRHLTGCNVYLLPSCNYSQVCLEKFEKAADQKIKYRDGLEYLHIKGTWFVMIDCDKIVDRSQVPPKAPYFAYFRRGNLTEKTSGFDMTDEAVTRAIARQIDATPQFKRDATSAFRTVSYQQHRDDYYQDPRDPTPVYQPQGTRVR